MLFIRKPMSALMKDVESNTELKRSLSAASLICLGVGAIVGAGLFSLTGIAAADNAGPAVTISFIIAAIGCLFAGLCYSEFASMLPIAGSAYTYSYATMGEFIAWIIGWDLVLEYALAAATVSVSWSRYLIEFLIRHDWNFIPYELFTSPFETLTLSNGMVIDNGVINLPAIFIVFVLSYVLILGTKGSAWTNNILVVLKLSVVFIFIIVGWRYMNPANHDPYIIANAGEQAMRNGEIGFWDFLHSDDFGHYGWSGILRGAAVVFFAFIGFDAVSTAAQEAKKPKIGMPVGILGSLIVCTILYVLFSHVMTGLAHYTEFINDAKPVATAIAHTPYNWLQDGIILAILAGYTSVILVMLLGQSRVFYSMSHDGLLPKMFSQVHKKYSTPWKTNLFFMIFVSLFAGFVPVSDLGHMVSIGTLFAFILVCIGVIIMRKTMPEVPRKFKVPFVPLIPILGILVCLLMMSSLPKESWERLIIWMAIGVSIYFLYSRKHSVVRKLEKRKEEKE
ncbi:amino acid permease [Parabacteroides sp. Marseille-P3160]|uniref:amino acid permease n=1 Tax=Parabacteroides sp. Marseille-P3160 TaxID=1917887 RepID=UPI0009BB28A5|nr:amino acid permease [Parabacteroides sp. Marseille-P3160]